jgi:hypothetical protein
MHFSTATHDFGYRLSTDDKSVYRLKNNGVFGDRTSLCPLKLICHIKDVFLDIHIFLCTSRPLPMISDTV